MILATFLFVLGMVSTLRDALHGHYWTILNGTQVTLSDLVLILWIIKMGSKDILCFQSVGSKIF